MKASVKPQPAIVQISRHYDAAAERVFDAWLDPMQARHFLFKTADGQMMRVDIDARTGGNFTIIERRDGQDAEHTGEFLEITRPNRLIFTFAVPDFPATRVTVDIAESIGGGCDLTLTHDGVLPEYVERTEKGWAMILEGLAQLLKPVGAQ
jgi:uncharacterized protein YndB with AHSA1/START domain